LTAETKATIDRLGPVKFVVGPDSVHHLFLGELVVATKVYSIGINPLFPRELSSIGLIPTLSCSLSKRWSRKKKTRI
jgi:hypothetical protein